MSTLTKSDFLKPGGSQQHLYIATPAHTICSNFHVSLLRSISVLCGAGVSVTYAHLAGHCHVDDARNLLVADFLSTDCTDLLFWDADVAAQPGAALKLVSYDVDIVGGAYPLKDGSEKFPVRLTGFTEPRFVGRDLQEADMMPTGFLRIRRNVFDQLLGNALAEPLAEVQVLKMDGVSAAVFFERGSIIGGGGQLERIGGDANFCRRAREAGFTVWCDPSLLFTHQGSVDFVGRLSDAMRAELIREDAAE